MYIASIVLCVIIISIINVFAVAPVINYSVLEIVFWPIIDTVIVIAIDGLLAYIVRHKLPEKYFSMDKKGFIAGKRESIFYEKIGIKKWKDKVLELGSFAGFRKNKLTDPTNNEYVKRFIVESNYGIGVHVSGIILGVLVVFCCPKALWLTVGLPVAIVNVFYNFLSYAILRYNLVKLHKLYRINEKRAQREVSKIAS